jgi:ribosomal protein L7/L12
MMNTTEALIKIKNIIDSIENIDSTEEAIASAERQAVMEAVVGFIVDNQGDPWNRRIAIIKAIRAVGFNAGRGADVGLREAKSMVDDYLISKGYGF